MNLLAFLWDNFALVVLALGYLAAIGAAYVYGGRNLAVVVATVGVGHLLYRTGRKHERDVRGARTKDVERRREDAYREIDDRGTTRRDAADRLRNNNF